MVVAWRKIFSKLRGASLKLATGMRTHHRTLHARWLSAKTAGAGAGAAAAAAAPD